MFVSHSQRKKYDKRTALSYTLRKLNHGLRSVDPAMRSANFACLTSLPCSAHAWLLVVRVFGRLTVAELQPNSMGGI